MVSEIWLLRHGQASFGADDYDRLSETGQVQARLLGEHLAALGLRFDAVYGGGMRRQRETARLMMEAMGHPQPDSYTLMEHFNEFDHLPVLREHLQAVVKRGEACPDIPRMRVDRTYFQSIFSEATRAWVAGEPEAPDLESWVDFCQRVESGMDQLLQVVNSGQRVLVSTSAGTISVALRYVLGTARENALDLAWVIRNSSLTRLLCNGRRITLEAFNSVAHLEREDRLPLITYR